MTNNLQILLFIYLTIGLVGGLNWIVTAYRTGSKPVPDLLNLIGIKQNISNIIYWIVGIVSIITLLYSFHYRNKLSD